MHRTLVALYLLGTTAVALFVRDLGVVVSLGGAVSAVIIIFFFPAAAYLSLLGPAGAEAQIASSLCPICLLTQTHPLEAQDHTHRQFEWRGAPVV